MSHLIESILVGSTEIGKLYICEMKVEKIDLTLSQNSKN